MSEHLFISFNFQFLKDLESVVLCCITMHLNFGCGPNCLRFVCESVCVEAHVLSYAKVAL